MEITLDELLEGKGTIIKNKEYFPSKQYVEPFINKMSQFTDDFIVRAISPNQLSTTKNNPDVIYNRVWVQAILPEDYVEDNHALTYGLTYGLDPRVPVAKLYKGLFNIDNSSLSVFDVSQLRVQEIEEGELIDLKDLDTLINTDFNLNVIVDRLKATTVNKDISVNNLGRWVDFVINNYDERGFGKIQIPTSTPITAYKQLFIDSGSKYYTKDNPKLFDIYNAFTDIISHDKRDILNVVDKTLLMGRMLNV